MSGAGKGAALAVLVDGEPLDDDEARAFWARFSSWMEAHRGDLAGFAKQEGFVSVHPATQGGRAVLLASRKAAQKAYTNAPVVRDVKLKTGLKAPGAPRAARATQAGGSSAPQNGRSPDAHTNGIAHKTPKK